MTMRTISTVILLFIIAIVVYLFVNHYTFTIHKPAKVEASSLGRVTAEIAPGFNYKITQDKRIGSAVVFEQSGKVMKWIRTSTVSGKLSVYASGHNPAITPDRKYIAYDNNGYIYRNHHRITRGTNPAITASGVFIAFERDNHIFLWNENTGNISLESRLTDRTIIEGHDPELSFHGNWLLFESNGKVMVRYLGGK